MPFDATGDPATTAAVTPLTPGEITLVTGLAAIVIMVAVWFRNPRWWVDALLWVAAAVGLGLLALVMAG